ncbi:hypothetical protein J7K44_03025 [bacterium]|nr:hypothetical protein [bacterium]
MEEVAKKQNIFWQGFVWYLFDVPKGILKGWENYLRYNLNYFSLPLLLKTLFAPWRRYKWHPGRGFDIKRWLEARISNLISRTLGAIMRIALILTGLLVEVLIILIGLAIIIGWFILPLFLIFLLYHGFRILL